MTAHDHIEIPGLPTPLRWEGTPETWQLENGSLTIRAGRRTDWFIDPQGETVTHNAPALLLSAAQPCLLKTRVSLEPQSTFDAGALVLLHNAQTWGKLALEFSPQGQLMIVSVVTRGVSDDCNSVPISGNAVYLRVAKLERAYAFHYSLDAAHWHLVRYFSLGEAAPLEIGFLAQSPMGEGCSAHFSEIDYRLGLLADLRSGE